MEAGKVPDDWTEFGNFEIAITLRDDNDNDTKYQLKFMIAEKPKPVIKSIKPKPKGYITSAPPEEEADGGDGKRNGFAFDSSSSEREIKEIKMTFKKPTIDGILTVEFNQEMIAPSVKEINEDYQRYRNNTKSQNQSQRRLQEEKGEVDGPEPLLEIVLQPSS